MAKFVEFVRGVFTTRSKSPKIRTPITDIIPSADDPSTGRVPLTKTRSASMSAPRTHPKDHHGSAFLRNNADSSRPRHRYSHNQPEMPDTTRVPPESKPEPKQEPNTCAICMDECSKPKELDRCGHIFCTACIDRYFNEVKPQCPCCFVVYGEMRGDQPEDGEMREKYTGHLLPGYQHDSLGTIEIYYRFPSGIQSDKHPNPGAPYEGTIRKAYLPDNHEGQHVLRLLKRAFHLRQTFTIGQSRTTGQENVVTWNDIHHKTHYNGGPANFGYPDPNYLKRVQQELAAKGIQ